MPTFSSLSLVRLHGTIPGISQAILLKILTWYHERQISLNEIFLVSAKELQKLFDLSEKTAQAIISSSEQKAKEILDALELKGFHLLTCFDDDYPTSLSDLPDYPALLYVKGPDYILSEPSLGFCGSRDVSDFGLQATRELSAYAVGQRYNVVSGNARGVDVAAHIAALEAGGTTTLVLPEGALKFSIRKELAHLIKRYEDRVTIVSEWSPLLIWSVQNAMARNKTIIGLSKALCIIESGTTGGTWDAGQKALALKKPFYVLDLPKIEGNVQLIKVGGTPIKVLPKMQFPLLNQPQEAVFPQQLKLF